MEKIIIIMIMILITLVFIPSQKTRCSNILFPCIKKERKTSKYDVDFEKLFSFIRHIIG